MTSNRNGRFIKNLPFFISLLFIIVLASCGSDQDEDNPVPPIVQEEEAQIEGFYKADLLSLNGTSIPLATGKASFIIQGDEVIGSIIMNNVSSEIPHYQIVHSSSRSSCPKMNEDDSNEDGFLDISEIVNKAGKGLLPLDSDLEVLAVSNFPLANNEKKYFWNSRASYSLLVSELQRIDNNPDDIFTNLEAGNLELEGKALVIYGAVPESLLPDSINASLENNRNLSLPVACGVIQKVQ